MKKFSDIDALHSQVVFLKMREKTTEELTLIWSENNQKAWNKDEFAAVQKILLDRLGKLPEQKEITEKKPSKTSFFNFNFNDKLSIAIVVLCLVLYFVGTIGMKLIPIIIVLLPLLAAFSIVWHMRRRSQLWLEAFALIFSLMFISYGILFWLTTKDLFLFKISIITSTVGFLGTLFWPITSPNIYQALHFKSVLFDGQSSVSKMARRIKNSRILSLLVAFLYFLFILVVIFYLTGFYK